MFIGSTVSVRQFATDLMVPSPMKEVTVLPAVAASPRMPAGSDSAVGMVRLIRQFV
jgi:hypothetical protein